jgi:hypothetical protein
VFKTVGCSHPVISKSPALGKKGEMDVFLSSLYVVIPPRHEAPVLQRVSPFVGTMSAEGNKAISSVDLKIR